MGGCAEHASSQEPEFIMFSKHKFRWVDLLVAFRQIRTTLCLAFQRHLAATFRASHFPPHGRKADCVILGAAGASVISLMKTSKATGLNQAIPIYILLLIIPCFLPTALTAPKVS